MPASKQPTTKDDDDEDDWGKSIPLAGFFLSHLPTLEPPPSVTGKAFVYILACSDGAL
jgi:hypothetical protein